MKSIRIIIITCLVGVLIYSLNVNKNTQNIEDYPVWIDMMETSNVNLEEARKAFDLYWNQNTHYRGDRSKQFERWYARNSKRLDALGNVISEEQVLNEYQNLRLNAAFTQQGQWYNYGPISVGARGTDKKDGGRVKDIAFHPTEPDTYYVSCFKSGLFKTTDAGKNWMPLTDHLAQQVYISKIHPSSPNTLYIGTSSGVLKSVDGGVNWLATGLSSSHTNALLIKPDNENIIIAGNDSGIYRSLDGGNTFSQVQSASKVEELKIHPTNPNIIYAGTEGSTSEFYRSIDGGASWVKNTIDFGTGAFMKIAVTPAQPNYVYVINSRDHLDQDSFDGVYLSTNSGASFTKQSGGIPCITGYDNNGSISRGQPNYNLFIAVDPVDANIVYAGGVKSWKSTNAGVTWTQVFNNVTTTGSLHLDQLTWAYSPINNKLFAVNDGGIWFLNGENKFQSITDGLPVAEVWECAQSQTNPSNVAGGTFHAGIKLNRDGVWYSPWGGDESTVLFDYSDDNYAYHFKYEKISRSTNGGFSFQRINPSSADRGDYTGTGILDKSDVNTLFVGLFEVERINNARTANSSTVWDKISSFGGSTKIKKIEQCDANHNILYVSRGTGSSFYRSDDVRSANPTFTDITSTLIGSGAITDIATHPADDNIVYVLRGNRVYKSANKGISWVDISTGLPNIALLEMVYDKSSNEGIYIGTDLGVYYKDATMSSWIDYSNGLPVIRVSGMDIYYGATRADSFLTVSTDGRGFWRSALNDITITPVTTNFTSNTQTVFVGNSVNFTDTSTNSPIIWEWRFEGGTPSSSNQPNPSVQYSTTGTFKVTLKSTNLGGTDTKEVINYITVTSNSGSGHLQGHYNFQGNLNDASSYSRNLNIVGSFTPTYTVDHNANPASSYVSPGITGKYLTNSYTGVGGNSERTVTAWIKTTTAGSRKTIVSWGTNSAGEMFNIMIHDGNIRVEGGSSNVQNDDAIVARLDGDTWRHIAVSYNPTDGDKLADVKMYIDGVYYANQPDSGDSYNSEGTVINTGNIINNMQIGNTNYTSGYYWQGQLDDIRVYSKALSLSEINTVMNGGTLLVENNMLNNKVHAYPNPVTNVLTLETSVSEKLHINVYNMLGELVKTESSKKINMSHLSSGLYIIEVIAGTKVANLKIVKK